MKRRFLVLLFLFFAFFTSQVINAQQRVMLQVNIAHKNGKPVPVDKSTLQLLENGSPVESFQLRTISSDAFSFAVVVDASGSTRNKIRHMQDYALVAFKLLSGNNGRGVVCLYADNAVCTPGYVSPEDAQKILGRMNPAGGSGLYGALWEAMDKLEEQAPDGVKVIVALSDGDNTLGTLQLPDVVRRAAKSKAVIIPIGLLDPDKRKERSKLLSEIATSTGTRAILLDEPGDVGKYLTNILGSQFTLIYESQLSALAERVISIVPTLKNISVVIAP